MPGLECVVGLGSNLGERLATLVAAARRLRQESDVRAVSALYESDPIGGPPQPSYLNAAILLDLGTEPAALLRKLQSIEDAFGRRRQERWGPRTLDLDVLWTAGPPISTPALTVPHPELHLRAFALLPLLDVAPDARDPRSGRGYGAVARRLGTAGVRRIAGPGWEAGDAS